MSKIQVLDPVTIDKIAAGEVVERPASIVKELAENAIDAGATAITVEIEDGGISYIRIADNGCGIDHAEVPAAFLRHATSKIHSAEDLAHIHSLGFRGEALSSIAAVSQVEMITKTASEPFGTHYRIAGGKEEGLEETGAKDGTTFIIRQLFYNTPARRKFLKTPMTEAGHVSDLMIHMALSHPDISFQFINHGQSRIHTSGNGNLRDVIYHIYGREIASNLLEIHMQTEGLCITGYLGKPVISRGNRNFENYFINGRYVKSQILSRAIEDAYKDFSMQHKYPFTALLITLDTDKVDVNVHPAKMEVRFQNQQAVYNTVYEAVSKGLHSRELIPGIELDSPSFPVPGAVPEQEKAPAAQKKDSGKPAAGKTTADRNTAVPSKERDLDYFMEQMRKRVQSYHDRRSSAEVSKKDQIFRPDIQTGRIREAVSSFSPKELSEHPKLSGQKKPAELTGEPAQTTQLNLFQDRFLEPSSRPFYRMIGQVFETYWMIEFQDQLYIIDQHAAHERVLYERTLKSMHSREYTSQMISPPIILNLSMQEAALLREHLNRFTKIGFEIEEFGQDSFAVRAVPDNLFGLAKKELLIELLDSLSEEVTRKLSPEVLDEKIASMSCKAAVKGNMHLSAKEVDALILELLTLDNPYHCPHGRPTIISMSKKELEKKFKRIV